jgi:hypothetical protein
VNIEAIKAQLFTAMTCIENVYAELAADEDAVCPHPVEKRDSSASTMGNLQWTCTVCGHTEKEEGGES